MGWLSNLITGGRAELGWDDLVRRVVDGIAALPRYGPRGEVVFPAEVTVRITVGEGSLHTVQQFVDRPELDREIETALCNRCDVAAADLPVRQYLVSPADRTSVTIGEGAPRAWQLVVSGGDRDGATLTLPTGWTEASLGRGEWHGADRHARNDLVVCERTEHVSRRAARLYRSGNHVEVASLDQGDQLLVRRATGEVVRPARTARGRVVVRPGDAIELSDGRGGGVRVILQRASG
jgi:hypothetical protein